MRTTLDLPDETCRRFKLQTALNRLKLDALVTQLIQRGLAAGVNAPMPDGQPNPLVGASERLAPSPTATTLAPSYPIPIAREADGTVTPYLSNAQLNAILDDEDLAQYNRVRSGASGQ